MVATCVEEGGQRGVKRPVLGLEGKTLIERWKTCSDGDGGVVDVMRDIFAHLMQKNEEVCRTMQKRRDTGTKKAKNVLRKKRKMAWMER